MAIERETYSAGKYSQVRLADGTRLLVEVLNEGFTVRLRMGAGAVIWSCNVLKKIRGIFKTSTDAKVGLDIILTHLDGVSSKDQLEDALANARSEIIDKVM